MLIVVSGLPGTGKSTVAAAVAARVGAVHLSIDELEDVLLASGVEPGRTTGIAAYEVARAAAEQALTANHPVVVDAVNDSEPARDTWRRAARASASPLLFLVLVPPDPAEHRRRLQSRARALRHVPEPTWQQVQARAAGFAPWPDEPLQIDAGQQLDDVVEAVLQGARRVRAAAGS